MNATLASSDNSKGASTYFFFGMAPGEFFAASKLVAFDDGVTGFVGVVLVLVELSLLCCASEEFRRSMIVLQSIAFIMLLVEWNESSRC